jgi:hypothetical protein
LPVAAFVSSDLRQPICAIGCGLAQMFGAPVTKAPINKNRDFFATENEIRFSHQLAVASPTFDSMQTENFHQF